MSEILPRQHCGCDAEQDVVEIYDEPIGTGIIYCPSTDDDITAILNHAKFRCAGCNCEYLTVIIFPDIEIQPATILP